MSTKRLKKRDRTWAKDMVILFESPCFGRGHSTAKFERERNARSSTEFIAGRDPFQQEALAIKP